MTMGDRIKPAALNAMGRAKEATGKVPGNQDPEAKVEADQAGASAGQAGDNVYGAAKDTFDH